MANSAAMLHADVAATRCDLNGNAATTQTKTTPRKEKTILGWLVKSASVSDKTITITNDNSDNSDNNNRTHSDCNCETRAFRDFRGVQTLRLLWTKRISSASEERPSQGHPQGQQQQSGLGTLRKLNKSVSCLVNAFNNARDWPSLTNAPETRAKRAASLHNLAETCVTSPLQRRDKDNFYKYKNAEQAKMQQKLRKSSSNNNNCEEVGSFPAVKAANAAGERLQWPKRADVVSKCKMESVCLSDKESREKERERERENALLISLISAEKTAAISRAVSLSGTSGSNESLLTINSINSNTTTATVTSQTRSSCGTSGTRRKYSFKTHAGKSYHQHHTPRRMSTHTHSHSHTHSHTHAHSHSSLGIPVAAEGGVAPSSAGSLVRQLTQQFNEIIQKDAKLLEQVKRKNGVWLSRGSHVYKIVEKPPQKQEEDFVQLRSSMVQRNIKKFEKLEKPAVPLKTEQILRKHQEHMNNARQSTLSLSKQMRSKRRWQQRERDGKLEEQRQEEEQFNEEQSRVEQVKEEQLKEEQLKEEQMRVEQVREEQIRVEQFKEEQRCVEQLNEEQLRVEQFKEEQLRVEQFKEEQPRVEQFMQEEQKQYQCVEQFKEEQQQDLQREEQQQQKLNSTVDRKLPENQPSPVVDDAIKPKPQASHTESAKELTQLPINDNSVDELDALEAERQQRRKHKYATIYEKLRFLPFSKSGKRSPQKKLPALEMEVEMEVEMEAEAEMETAPLPSPCVEADAKILAALEVLDQKLKILAEPGATKEREESELLLAANDDFEQRILPNNSFVYQAANKQISNNQLLLNQAVNVTLVNAIEGEQMIMEQKQLELQQGMKVEAEVEAEAEIDSMYEPITPTAEAKTEPQASSLFKLTQQLQGKKEDIYQSLEESTKSTNWLEGYESIAGSTEANNKCALDTNDDYEAFATPTTAEDATATPILSSTGTLGRNTRDQLPELPKPKRVLHKSPVILRAAPAKPKITPDEEEEEEEEEENIYDTIKGCYESMSHTKLRKHSDAVSLSSNCYESISNYRKSKVTPAGNGATSIVTGSSVVQLSSSGSSLTISSDHRTNSLYESSLAAGVLYGSGSGSASVGCRSSLASSSVGSGSGSGSGSGRERSKPSDKRSSIAGSSDNSDAWVDISDGEAALNTHNESQFIVVRERFKQHRVRSPDWSKRIRDKRLQQNKAKSCIEDDSDHYYETLSPLGNKRHSTQLLPGQHHKRNVDLPRASQRRSKQHSASAHALGEHVIHSDDYDSFESDSDEHTEQEQRLQHHNDSGVDMRNHRLPEPPTPQNQVYAIVRKFKDFISSKKSPKSSQQKLYENTGTQFYVECRKQEKEKEKDIYDNARSLSSSEKTLNLNQSGQEQLSSASLLRPKPKNGKSLRSRLRKSLVGSSFDTKQLSTLTPTRSTFYIEDPPAEQLDSGFSEKVMPGEMPTTESQKFSTVARKTKKEAKASRRRATIGVRPHEPPPPPPPPPIPSPSQLEASATQPTSWYAECGVFKQSANGELATPTPSANGGGSSWYAESGLYQTSGNSVASSSGSSGVSTGNEAGLGDDLQPHSLFSNEPLYQVYSAAKLESITRDLEAQENSTDGYEEIGLQAHTKLQSTTMQAKARPTALQLVEPKNGPSRTLWSEIPEVIHSCILPTLTPRERGLQEAKFEIMTSEASYLKSLNLLRRHFMNNTAFCDTSVLSARDRKALFSYIVPVHECSERLLTELECCWQNNIMLLGLSRCIYEIAERHFQVYITFCEHQGRMDRTLRRLKEAKNGAFQQHLDKLEANPSCCGLNLHSFLMLPMQRITRLPLLIDAVFSKESPHNSEEYESWKMTLSLVQKIVSQCNEAANRWEQAYELERISKQLEFPSYIRALAIAPVGVPKQGAKPRYLVKKGELTQLIWRGDDAKLTFGKRFTKSSIYAFLFSDLLVLCKRKGESNFTVFDYCPRSMLTLASGDNLPQLPTKDLKDPTSKNLMLITLLENYERKTIELVLSCPSVSDQQRWLEAMRPPEAETPGEKLYESWDCPQVIAKHSYESDEPDVLQLELGDVVNVSRKLPDGWYQGERIRDGAVGWFPGSYTEELNSSHVRARNLKQRYRLLTFTATYLESQKAK